MVARKIDTARRAIQRQLAEWGSPSLDLADLDPEAILEPARSGRLSRLATLSGPPGA